MAWLCLLAGIASAQAPAGGGWTLEAAVREALEASHEVRAAARRRDEAALEEPALLAELDPRFETAYEYADDRAPRASPAFQGSRSRSEGWEAGLVQRTLLGTEAKVVMRNDRLMNPTPFRPVDPTVDSRLNLELRQPLWRYFAGRPDIARRRRARAATAAADNAWRQAREDAAGRAARAFLEWRHAAGAAAISEQGVADARSLLAKYEDKRRYGLAEESDLLQAQASVESQEIGLLVSRSGVETARRALLAALDRPDGELPAVDPAPVTRPAALDGLGEDEAISGRPELETARQRRARAEWDLRVARLDTFPELTVSAAYGFAGLDSSYGRSWKDLGSWDHPVASAGASLSLPLGFRRERLTREGARLRLEAAAADAGAAETSARRERRDAVEALRLARRKMEAGRRLLDIERRKSVAEEAQFRRGRSSTDLLLRFQQDIRRARSELLRAETDEAIARVELARVSGRLAQELAP